MKQFFNYTLLRWKTFIIYGVTKFCTPKGKPKIVKSRLFKIFDTYSFHADLSLAPWHLVSQLIGAQLKNQNYLQVKSFTKNHIQLKYVAFINCTIKQ